MNSPAAEQPRQPEQIRVMIVADSRRQRQAFSDTVNSCGFHLIDCVSQSFISPSSYAMTDLWLIDEQDNSDLLQQIEAKSLGRILVGFSQAPYIHDQDNYARWQMKLKRKLAELLDLPDLIERKRYHGHISPWYHVVLLGASMGGPTAVKQFLDHLSPDLPICLLLAHHFDASMLVTLPHILTRHNEWHCKIISSSRSLQSRHCLLVPINQQMVCDSYGRVILLPEPWQGEYKPEIGRLLKNASEVFGAKLISIIFSGMGRDGSQHLDVLRDNQSQIWAQDPNESDCPSQPQAIIDSGYCQFVGTSQALAQRLTQYVKHEQYCQQARLKASTLQNAR